MHSQQCLLVKARSKPEAIEKAELFLERYRGIVWDWYQFGGRGSWSEVLQKSMNDLTVRTEFGRSWKDAKTRERGHALRTEINRHLPKVVSAEEANFFDLLQEALERHEAEFRDAAVYESEDRDPDTREYWTHVVQSLAAGDIYDHFVHFFDTVRERSDFPPELEDQLRNNPRGWNIVNVNIHW